MTGAHSIGEGRVRAWCAAVSAAVAAVVLLAGWVLAATSGPGPSPGASGVPMPVGDQPGWRQVFTDDFTGDRLDDRWFRYGPGEPLDDPGGWFDPDRVAVGDDRLTISARPDPELAGRYATGGVSNRNSFAQTYGKFEFRFRAQQGTGIAYALLLWPASNDERPEIDIAEDNGRDRRTLHGFLHPADPARPSVENSVSVDTTRWHTAGLEWTPQRLVYTLDGRPWAVVEGPQVPDVPMSLALQSQAWYCGDTWQACPDASTPDRVDLEIDWVSIYAHDP